MSAITLVNLHKRFGDFTAVRNTDLVVGDGRFVVLLGPSGCGKTTTLRMIAGLELPTSGQILIDGEDVTALRARQRDIAFVFQMFALYPHMTVRNNIAFPLKNEHVSRREITARVDAAARIDAHWKLPTTSQKLSRHHFGSSLARRRLRTAFSSNR